MKLYRPKHVPMHWVVLDLNSILWLVAAKRDGWKERRAFRGAWAQLEEVTHISPVLIQLLYGIPFIPKRK